MESYYKNLITFLKIQNSRLKSLRPVGRSGSNHPGFDQNPKSNITYPVSRELLNYDNWLTNFVNLDFWFEALFL
jgi:hypothetical protein